MNLKEYEKIKDLDYESYCNYLQLKYGIGLDDYMTKNYKPKPKCKRTKEGLFAHHKKEDCCIKLSDTVWAKRAPYEYQLKENIVYCDYLEHLLLHILICEKESELKLLNIEGIDVNLDLGIGGIVSFMIPELNDWYSGFQMRGWKEWIWNKIKDDKDVYIKLVRRFMTTCCNKQSYYEDCVFNSLGAVYGTWWESRNKALYDEIRRTK